MANVWIPALLRDLTDGQETVQAAGATVAQVIEELEQRFPGIRERLCAGDQLRRGLVVAVDTQLAPQGLRQPVSEQSEVHFLPAISGGQVVSGEW